MLKQGLISLVSRVQVPPLPLYRIRPSCFREVLFILSKIRLRGAGPVNGLRAMATGYKCPPDAQIKSHGYRYQGIIFCTLSLLSLLRQAISRWISCAAGVVF
jgi:hypothetical protein